MIVVRGVSDEECHMRSSGRVEVAAVIEGSGGGGGRAGGQAGGHHHQQVTLPNMYAQVRLQAPHLPNAARRAEAAFGTKSAPSPGGQVTGMVGHADRGTKRGASGYT